MKCPHECGVELKCDPKKDQKSYIYECPKCKCTFRLVIVYWYPKCYAKFHKGEYMPKKAKPKKIKKKEVEDDE
jgi:ribosomal protein L37AE/L43A